MQRDLEHFGFILKLFIGSKTHSHKRFGTYIIMMFLATSVFANLATSSLQAKPADEFLKNGKALMSAGHFPAAASAFTQAINADSSKAEALQLRGFLLFWMNKPEAAIIDLDKAVKLDPGPKRIVTPLFTSFQQAKRKRRNSSSIG